MNSHLYTADFISSICYKSPCGVNACATSLLICFAGPVSLSNVSVDGGSCHNITLKGNVPVALCVCVF